MIRVDELTYGDRFRVNGALWTVVDISWMKTGEDWIVARKHGPESATLGDKGYGYIGDSICSFEASQLVEFVPANGTR